MTTPTTENRPALLQARKQLIRDRYLALHGWQRWKMTGQRKPPPVVLPPEPKPRADASCCIALRNPRLPEWMTKEMDQEAMRDELARIREHPIPWFAERWHDFTEEEKKECAFRRDESDELEGSPLTKGVSGISHLSENAGREHLREHVAQIIVNSLQLRIERRFIRKELFRFG